MNVKIMKVRMLCAMVTLLCACSVFGAKTFTNVSGTDWNTPENWGGTLPIQGDDVIIDGNVVLTNSTPALNSYTLNVNRWHTFDGWDTTLSAVTVGIYGTMTHTNNLATTTNSLGVWVPNARVKIVCTDMNIPSSGKIDVGGKGYAGGLTGGLPGYGPGFGNKEIGAGHGGAGGRSDAASGRTYGLFDEPSEPGSGGGSTTAYGGSRGGFGGGAVLISASGVATVDGSIIADGTVGGRVAASGSGGSVKILCHTLQGAGGSIFARGGDAYNSQSASGGGGRISIVYDQSAQAALPLPSIAISSCAGLSKEGPVGDVGTLYFTDSQFFLRQTGTINMSGEWCAPGLGSVVEKDSLSLKNVWLRFPMPGMSFNITNGISVVGTDSWSHRLEFTNALVNVGGNIGLSKAALSMNGGHAAGSVISCDGNLWVTNTSRVIMRSGIVPNPPEHGLLVDVGGDITIGTASWVYPYAHPTNGGTVLFRARDLLIPAAASGINADGAGYQGGYPLQTVGYGPGRGVSGCGAAYGGNSGVYANAIRAMFYGDPTAPIYAGSGTGSHSTDKTLLGSSGGGAVRIEATGAVLVNGTITANGRGAAYKPGGGASGGGIYIQCSTFAGTNGIVDAKGGNDWFGSTGGGGRIAVVYDTVAQNAMPLPTVVFNTAPGAGSAGIQRGDVGTLYFPDHRLLTDSDVYRHSGQWMVPGLTQLSKPSLNISSGWLRLPHSGFALDIANNISIAGTDSTFHKLELSNAVVNCGGNISLAKSSLVLSRSNSGKPELHCAGSMFVTNASTVYVYGGMSASPDEYGAFVSTEGDVTLDGGSIIYPYSHPTNGGSVFFRVRNLSILDTASGINADGRGFAGGTVPYNDGFGPGGGKTGGGGAGYGGLGGGAGVAEGTHGQTYGLAHAPTQPGSGGGTEKDTAQLGWPGGGYVRVEASDAIVMNGKISANSVAPDYGMGTGRLRGGGSGGGVMLVCRKMSGSGTISAKGGDGWDRAGGGGGRIAIWEGVWAPGMEYNLSGTVTMESLPDFTGTFNVLPGATATSILPKPEAGTIAFIKPNPPSVIIVR